MVNALCKSTDKLHIINALIAKMAGVEVEAKALMLLHSSQRSLGRSQIKGNFCRVNFQSKVNLLRVKNIEDRRPAF